MTVVTRHLTREEQGILDLATLKALKIVEEESGYGMQDGILSYYLSQAKLSDVNIEAQVNREPFDYRSYTGGASAFSRTKQQR